mgnify:CR=1 FL=1
MIYVWKNNNFVFSMINIISEQLIYWQLTFENHGFDLFSDLNNNYLKKFYGILTVVLNNYYLAPKDGTEGKLCYTIEK